MKPHRNTIWLLPLFLLLTFPLWSKPLGVFLTPRGGFDPEVKKAPEKTRVFSLDTIRITQSQKGQTTAIILADHAQTTEIPDEILLTKVDADLYNEQGEITKVTSKRGRFNTATELLILEDDVVVHKKEDNQFLYTDLLHYDNALRTVYCPGPSSLVGDGVSINGGQLHYDINSETYRIDKRVHVTIDNFDSP